MYRLLSIIILLSISLASFPHDKYSLKECSDLFEEGKLEQAMPSLLNIYDELSKSDSWNEDDFATAVMLIANYYTSIGDLRSTENIYRDATDVFKKKSTLKNTELIRTLYILTGQLEIELSNFDRALVYLETAQLLYENESNYDSLYFQTLCSIAACHYNKKDFAMAELYIQEAEEIHLKNIGRFEDSTIPQSHILVIFKGLLNQHYGKMDEAASCYLSVIKSTQGDEVLAPVKDIALNNLANLYTLEGKYDDALELYAKINLSNPTYAFTHFLNAATAALTAGYNDKAVEFLNKSNSYCLESLNLIINNFAEVERELYWRDISDKLVAYNNLFAFNTDNPTARKLGFEINSFTRDFVFNFQQIIKNAYLLSSDSIKRAKWDDYQRNRGILSYGFDSVEMHDSIANVVINLEREILSDINIDIPRYVAKNYNTDILSRLLKPNEAIIDFADVPILKSKSTNDSAEYHLSAYILTRNNKIPRIVPACRHKDIASIVLNRHSDAQAISSIYTEYNDTIYKLILEPILPYLEGKSKFYIRTAGLLSYINIEAIKLPDGRYFGDAYGVNIVSNFDNISKSESKVSYTDITLFGDPDFLDSTHTNKQELPMAVPPGNEYQLITRGDRGDWGQLPATRTEVNNIRHTASTYNIDATMFAGKDASESMVKSLSGKAPSILHLATHGYFIETKERVASNNFLLQSIGYSQANQLMLFSGLLFSGANRVWNGKARPNPIDDGILTAEEITRLDLRNTQLVVLSACDTGRGYEYGNNGAIGLQRAFRAAGAKTMITSLWKIPDDATALLMQYFYAHLFSNNSARESLKLAQADIRKAGYTDPYYWAAFIVID